jgi:hypothetical protein
MTADRSGPILMRILVERPIVFLINQKDYEPDGGCSGVFGGAVAGSAATRQSSVIQPIRMLFFMRVFSTGLT